MFFVFNFVFHFCLGMFFCVPKSTTTTYTEANGCKYKTTIEDLYDEILQKNVKVKRVFKLTTEKIKIPKTVLMRKNWTKFGTSRGFTSEETIDIKLNLRLHDIKINKDNDIEVKKAVIVCRFCGSNEHWTVKCNKQQLQEQEQQQLLLPQQIQKLQHPQLKMQQLANSCNLKFSNLPDDMTKSDMYALCNNYGEIVHIGLAMNNIKTLCRGHGFVTYKKHEEALRAFKNINGKAYNHLILHVEFVIPFEKKNQIK